MKRFLQYIFGIFGLTLLLAILLDFTYTSIHSNATIRNKFQQILKNDQSEWDYIFLGSSRTANHIDAPLIEKLTGKKVHNYGIEGALLKDSELQLKLLIYKKVKIKKVFLQVDQTFENTKTTMLATSLALPFIHNPVIATHLKEDVDDFNALYYIPLYRYLTAEHTIGLREVILKAAGKSSKSIDLNGYLPKEGQQSYEEYILPKNTALSNKSIENIQKLCRDNNIELVLFTAPICPLVKNIEYINNLKKRLPGLLDFSQSIAEEKYYYDCSHLNRKGAEKFTRMLLDATE